MGRDGRIGAPFSRISTRTVPATYSAQEVSEDTSAFALPYSVRQGGHNKMRKGQQGEQSPLQRARDRLITLRRAWAIQKSSQCLFGRVGRSAGRFRDALMVVSANVASQGAVTKAAPIGVPSAERRASKPTSKTALRLFSWAPNDTTRSLPSCSGMRGERRYLRHPPKPASQSDPQDLMMLRKPHRRLLSCHVAGLADWHLENEGAANTWWSAKLALRINQTGADAHMCCDLTRCSRRSRLRYVGGVQRWLSEVSSRKGRWPFSTAGI